MSIGARCGSCNRELLLGQLVHPIADTLPEVETMQPALAREHRARWWAGDAAAHHTQAVSQR
jgi:hypothetical protein